MNWKLCCFATLSELIGKLTFHFPNWLTSSKPSTSEKDNAFVCDEFVFLEFGIWDCVMNKNVDKRPGQSLCQVHNKFVFILCYILAVKLYITPLAKISWTLAAWLSDIYLLSRLSLPLFINCHFSSTCIWILGLQLLVQAYVDKRRFDFD